MKYIKSFEDFEARFWAEDEYYQDTVSFKIGDHVKPIKSTGDQSNDLHKDEIYTIDKIFPDVNRRPELQSSENPEAICDVRDKKGKLSSNWWLKRFKLAEVEYTVNKFNL